MRHRWLVSTLAVCFVGTTAVARHFEFEPFGPFALESTRGIGGAVPGRATAASLAGARIAALADGGAIAIDADSGSVIRVDAAGTKIDELAVGANAGMMVYDPAGKVAYVADRQGDRVVMIAVGDKLVQKAAWPVAREPYGVALSPDRKTLFVTAIADRMLVELDPVNGRLLHATKIEREPRGVAIAPDGAHAMIAHLTLSGVTEIGLANHEISTRALPVRFASDIPRAAFTPLYLDDRLALVPFQRSSPIPDAHAEENPGSYGGADEVPPIQTFLAFFNGSKQIAAGTSVQQPRALARDAANDAVYIAGLGNDRLVRIARASQVDVVAGGEVTLSTKALGVCGPDGVAVNASGTEVLVWCSFSRAIGRVPVNAKGAMGKVTWSASLVASTMDAERHEGMVLFHTADVNVSMFGALACGSCHLDGRADGLSWRIHGENLQTPMLGGRLADTAPFKWDGKAKDLQTSVRATVERLGGDGLAKRHVASLVAYLETMPPVRPPSGVASAVERGKKLFDSGELGCTQCHDGAAMTDRETHQLHKGGAMMDTPSLRGLAASAPYFHDGSAATLEALLRERGTVHDMAGSTRSLTDAQVRDLVAFLESL